jgi:hypothetical protein
VSASAAPDAFGCRIWTGRLDRDGYGRDGRRQAHIVAWEAEFGPVPEGFELDHRCRRRACTALHHLDAVTRRENSLRKAWKRRARETKCPKGHDMTVNRVVVPPNGGVVCRACNLEARKAA